MIPERYCIFIPSLPNYPHSRAFDEIALSLHYAFQELGYLVPIIRYPWEIRGKPIVLGAHLLDYVKGFNLPQDTVLYNLEQIHEGSPWLTRQYIERLGKYRVWDYSRQNIIALKKIGINHVTLCEIGYIPALENIRQRSEEDKDIDILFYGSINPRRKSILEHLKRRGLSVTALYGVYGNLRDLLIERAKIVMNIHFYESKVMEIVRLSYLLTNRTFIISEKGSDLEMERPFQEGIVFANFDALVETCERFVKNPEARLQIADKGFHIFQKRNQTDFLSNALVKL